jgi:hypothetical protein
VQPPWLARCSEHNSCTAWTFVKLKRWPRWLGSSRLNAVAPIRCLAGQSYGDSGRMRTFVLRKTHSKFYEFGHSKMGSLKIMH